MEAKTESKELKFINEKVSKNPSNKLKELRAKFKAVKFPSDNVIEFFLAVNEVEQLKEAVRKETKGNCYFFTREENGKTFYVDGKVHLLVFYNIENIANLIEQLKVGESFSTITASSLKKMDFEKTITFGTPLKSKKVEPSDKEKKPEHK